MSEEEVRALDELISQGAISAHRIRQLHKPKGWGEKMRCSLCSRHGDRVWPCMTLKALEPWRWDEKGNNRYD